MSRKLTKASLITMAGAVFIAIFAAAGSGAAAQKAPLLSAQSEPQPSVAATAAPATPDSTPSADDDASAPAVSAASLSDLVAEQPTPSGDELSPDLKCLASAVYFEARNETLSGQLAVARVIVARTRSGRFPDSYCGVVMQPSQFSFVHGHVVPAIKDTRSWRRSLAIAEIAHAGTWQSPVEGALFFHAARVSPAWHRERIARIDNHIFYR